MQIKPLQLAGQAAAFRLEPLPAVWPSPPEGCSRRQSAPFDCKMVEKMQSQWPSPGTCGADSATCAGLARELCLQRLYSIGAEVTEKAWPLLFLDLSKMLEKRWPTLYSFASNGSAVVLAIGSP